jgi:hypothetical protein
MLKASNTMSLLIFINNINKWEDVPKLLVPIRKLTDQTGPNP